MLIEGEIPFQVLQREAQLAWKSMALEECKSTDTKCGIRQHGTKQAPRHKQELLIYTRAHQDGTKNQFVVLPHIASR